MRLHHTGCNPNFFTGNNTEFNNGPGCGVVIAIIIDDYAEHWRRSSKQENEPQQPPTQVSLNQCHCERSFIPQSTGMPEFANYSIKAFG